MTLETLITFLTIENNNMDNYIVTFEYRVMVTAFAILAMFLECVPYLIKLHTYINQLGGFIWPCSFGVNHDTTVAVVAETDSTGDRGRVQGINQSSAKQGDASDKTVQCISRWAASTGKSHLCVLHGGSGGKEGR